MSPAKVSAGLLMYRRNEGELEFFLAHPGGPFWAKKDEGAWSIPKGEVEENEVPRQTALREFQEEIGIDASKDHLIPLGEIRQKGGKVVHAWAFEGEWDESRELPSSTFEMEWPPRSGNRKEFPEIDKAVWFRLGEAKKKINPAQAEFLSRLADRV